MMYDDSMAEIVQERGNSLFEPSFDEDEYARRLVRTQARMEQRGYDLLLVADPANVNYLTGYDCWSFYTPQLLAVPLAASFCSSRVRWTPRARC